MAMQAMQAIVHVSLVVPDQDEAVAFYAGKLDFEIIEDTYQPEQDKRWVVIAPPGFRETGQGAALVLGRASTPQQEAAIGNQTGGRVFLFLRSDDFDRQAPFKKSVHPGFDPVINGLLK